MNFKFSGQSFFNTRVHFDKNKLMDKAILIILLVSISLSGCSDDENEITALPNQNPGSFSVQVTEITNNSSLIVWNPAIDPDGDPVSYTVFLDDNEVQSSNQHYPIIIRKSFRTNQLQW